MKTIHRELLHTSSDFHTCDITRTGRAIIDSVCNKTIFAYANVNLLHKSIHITVTMISDERACFHFSFQFYISFLALVSISNSIL